MALAVAERSEAHPPFALDPDPQLGIEDLERPSADGRIPIPEIGILIVGRRQPLGVDVEIEINRVQLMKAGHHQGRGDANRGVGSSGCGGLPEDDAEEHQHSGHSGDGRGNDDEHAHARRHLESSAEYLEETKLERPPQKPIARLELSDPRLQALAVVSVRPTVAYVVNHFTLLMHFLPCRADGVNSNSLETGKNWDGPVFFADGDVQVRTRGVPCFPRRRAEGRRVIAGAGPEVPRAVAGSPAGQPPRLGSVVLATALAADVGNRVPDFDPGAIRHQEIEDMNDGVAIAVAEEDGDAVAAGAGGEFAGDAVALTSRVELDYAGHRRPDDLAEVRRDVERDDAPNSFGSDSWIGFSARRGVIVAGEGVSGGRRHRRACFAEDAAFANLSLVVDAGALYIRRRRHPGLVVAAHFRGYWIFTILNEISEKDKHR